MDDFINFTPEHCKRLMIEYQETRDYEIFHTLLAKYDRFILSVIYKFQRKCWSLQEEELQDLYHTGIVGFVKAITSMKETTEAKFILNHIKAYVVRELKMAYLPNHPEPSIEDNILHILPPDNTEDFQREVTAHMLIESGVITKRERQLLNLYYFEGLSVRKIGKRYRTCHSVIVDRLKKIRHKLRMLINSSDQKA